MISLHIDFETRSALDLKQVGLHRYARDPSTDVWCMAWALGEHDPSVLPQHMAARENHPWSLHVKHGGRVVAHNAAFELAIWNEIMVPRYGWPSLKPEQTYCTMAMCYAMGLPGKLDDAASALGLELNKDMEGRALMLRMSRPRKTNVDGSFTWWTDEDKLHRLYEYCKQDVRVERAIEPRVYPLSEKERKVWLMDYAINQRGVKIDIETAKAALIMAETVKERCNAELSSLTAGTVQTVGAVAALKVWMAERGVVMDSVAKQAVVDALDTAGLPDDIVRALLLRQEAGKASTAKIDRMVDAVGNDGRLHNLYQYHGAAPGRWAGRGVQVHNLPRDMPDSGTVETVLRLVREGNYTAIDAVFGPPLTMISKCLRSFFMADEGKVLISGDWSNVESRGIAWFANEAWKLDAFRAQDAKTGPDVYKLGASRLLHCPVDQVTSEQRQGYGKVPDLAFGYGGGVGSGKTMGKTYGVVATDEEWDARKEAWRDSHPNVAGIRASFVREDGEVVTYRKGGIWKQIEEAAIAAVQNPGEKFTCGHSGREATWLVAGSFLWCALPSGRVNCYPYPKILPGRWKPTLTYMTQPNETTEIIYDEANASNWVRVSTWGGTLLNNIVQGFCRDFLAGCMLRLHEQGAAIVLHTHDDVNIEVRSEVAVGARKAVEDYMRAPPAWADGFPLFAETKILTRYGK